MAQHSEIDSLDSFRSESEPVRPRSRISIRRAGLAVVAVTATIVAGWFTWQASQAPTASAEPAPVAATGTVIFESVPPGALITIDGEERGHTPLRVSMPVGSYSAQISSGGASRSLPLTVQANAVVSHYVELGAVAAAADAGGRIDVSSDPAGLPVRLNGYYHGLTPLTLEDVPAGTHAVSVGRRDSLVTREVTVAEGAVATVFMSAQPSPALTGGWLVVDSPVDMEIAGPGGIVGTTRGERLMLPVGTHQITFSNPALEYSVSRSVEIAAGETAQVSIPLPGGRLSVNATPWAEVWIDGRSAGITPLGDLVVPIGSHELVFRHPQLGERRQTVLVRAQSPTRVGVDLRK